MSKRKGVSADEKRKRLMEIFHETCDFFQLQELEKVAPKEKGINSRVVKEVLQSLVDDGLVTTELVGTSNYFWSYPSTKKVEVLEETLKTNKAKLAESLEFLEQEQVGKEDTQDYLALEEQLSALTKKRDGLLRETEKFKDCDPEVFQQMQKDTQIAKDAANRWTDNIYSVKSWCKNKFCIDEGTIDKQFGIPAEMDYID